jgi:hypothetical protein
MYALNNNNKIELSYQKDEDEEQFLYIDPKPLENHCMASRQDRRQIHLGHV